MKFVQYEINTGFIQFYRETSNNNYVLKENEIEVQEYINGLNHYVNEGLIKERPNQNTEWTTNKLINLPVPCTVFINNTSYSVEVSEIELELDSGNHTIRVEAFPYKDKTYEVSV